PQRAGVLGAEGAYMIHLSEGVAAEGYQLVVGELSELTKGPEGLRPLGEPMNGVAVCEGYVIACPLDCWDFAYCVSHEIAEHRYGFQHSETMFSEQANILARWLRRATFARDRLLTERDSDARPREP